MICLTRKAQKGGSFPFDLHIDPFFCPLLTEQGSSFNVIHKGYRRQI